MIEAGEPLHPNPIDPRQNLVLAKKSFRIFVGGLRYSAKEEDLRPLFQKYGKVNSVIIPLQKNGSRCGSAIILMEKESEAREAIEKLNNLVFLGRRLDVLPYVPKTKEERDRIKNMRRAEEEERMNKYERN